MIARQQLLMQVNPAMALNVGVTIRHGGMAGPCNVQHVSFGP